MRERRVLRVVLAAFVVGMIAVAGLAAVDDDSAGSGGRPPRLPPLAFAAAGREAGAGAGAVADSMPATGPVEYRVAPGALDVALPDRASAWTIADSVDAEDVRRLASALGVDGTPKDDDTSWTVRDDDHQLRVEKQPGAPWSFAPWTPGCGDDAAVSSDGAVSCGVVSGSGSTGSAASGAATSGSATATVVAPPATTEEIAPCAAPHPAGADGATAGCTPPSPPETVARPADLPTKADAERLARDLLAKVGIDIDGATVRTDDGGNAWMVAVDPAVGGLPTQGMATTISVGSKGVIELANGWLGVPTDGDDYPLAGVQAGIERLKAGYPGGGWSAYPGAPEPAIATDVPACANCDPQVRTITGVRLGLQFSPVFSEDDGAPADALLVPAYFFRFDDSEFEQPVVAVADDFLPKPPDVKPMPEPAPLPVEPNGGPGGQEPQKLGASERAEIGRGYYVDVSTHCGVYALQFDGRWWDADPPLGDGNPPKGWNEPTEGGTFTLSSPSEGTFVGDADATKTAHFVVRPPDAGDPPGCT